MSWRTIEQQVVELAKSRPLTIVASAAGIAAGLAAFPTINARKLALMDEKINMEFAAARKERELARTEMDLVRTEMDLMRKEIFLELANARGEREALKKEIIKEIKTLLNNNVLHNRP
jgi:hypothetical protein